MLTNRKIDISSLFLIVTALIFSSILRVTLLGLYPLLLLAFLGIFNFRFSKNLFNLLGIILIAWLLSLRHGFYLKYNLVSFYYYISFIFLLLARPSPKEYNINPLHLLMGALTCFVIINNCLGIFQYFSNPDDDSFVGIYGRFTVTQNGLVLLNIILFFWYFQLYFSLKKTLHLLASFFFIFCAVLGFYGGGLMVLFGAFVLFYMRFSLRGLLKLFLVVVLLGVIVYFLMALISPKTLEYNINILNRFLTPSITNAPRKLIIFYTYANNYPGNILDFLLGSGPGTFNSRSAFMVGSPTYFSLDLIKSDFRPWYFNNLAYPLWNPSVVTRYDGFMNQPFSSLLAFLGEYGLLITIALLWIVLKQYLDTLKLLKLNRGNSSIAFYGRLYKFFFLFVMLLCVVDNYVEYPEITGLLLMIIKLSEQQILTQEASQYSMTVEDDLSV